MQSYEWIYLDEEKTSLPLDQWDAWETTVIFMMTVTSVSWHGSICNSVNNVRGYQGSNTK